VFSDHHFPPLTTGIFRSRRAIFRTYKRDTPFKANSCLFPSPLPKNTFSLLSSTRCRARFVSLPCCRARQTLLSLVVSCRLAFFFFSPFSSPCAPFTRRSGVARGAPSGLYPACLLKLPGRFALLMPWLQPARGFLIGLLLLARGSSRQPRDTTLVILCAGAFLPLSSSSVLSPEVIAP